MFGQQTGFRQKINLVHLLELTVEDPKYLVTLRMSENSFRQLLNKIKTP